MKRMKLLLTLAIPVLLAQSTLAQTTMSRLVGSAMWSNNGASYNFVDSSAYSYSGNNGGDLTTPMQYDTATTWVWDDTTYMNSTMTTNTYDTNNNLSTSTLWNWDTSVGSWVLVSKDIYTYMTSGSMWLLNTDLYQTFSSGWNNVSEYSYNYTGGQLTKTIYSTWNTLTGAFDPSSAITYAYDGSNVALKTDYTYNSVTASYSQVDEYNYNYVSGTNYLQQEVYSTYNAATLSYVPNWQYINTYDSAYDMLSTLYQTYEVATAAWDNQTFNVFGNFTNMMPQMEIDQVWDTVGGGSFDTTMMYMNTYNSFNQLTNRLGESYHVGGFFEFQPGNPEYNYYYQAYTTNNTGVKNVKAAIGSLSTFPVPAQNFVNINLSLDVPQASTIAIYDMSGRILRQWETSVTNQYTTTIAINDLASGNYVILVSGKLGKLQSQITVAH